jgi:hypothetical protein
MHSHHDTSRCSQAATEPFGVGQVAAEHQQCPKARAGSCSNHKTKGQRDVAFRLQYTDNSKRQSEAVSQGGRIKRTKGPRVLVYTVVCFCNA